MDAVVPHSGAITLFQNERHALKNKQTEEQLYLPRLPLRQYSARTGVCAIRMRINTADLRWIDPP